MHYTIPAILSLASLAAAVPTREQSANPWEGVLDPLGQYGRKPETVKRSDIEYLDDNSTNSTNIRIDGRDYSPSELLNLAKRTTTIDSFVGKIPGCGSEDDPSNADTPIPGWPVNHGVKIPKSGKDDACTTGHNGDHCWTEYYLVEAAVEYFSWLPTGSAINCSPGAKNTCSVAVTSMAQSCSLTSTSSTEGYDWKIIDAAGTVNIEFEKWGLKNSGALAVGGGISKNWANTEQKATNVCRHDSSTATCTWANDGTDNLCHQVWYADRVLHVWGQAQRVCNKCTNGNVQQNTGDGNVCVRGQKEFDFRLPINKLVHCNGACGSNDPGLNQPPNEPRAPYVAPNNWDLLVIGN